MSHFVTLEGSDQKHSGTGFSYHDLQVSRVLKSSAAIVSIIFQTKLVVIKMALNPFCFPLGNPGAEVVFPVYDQRKEVLSM